MFRYIWDIQKIKKTWFPHNLIIPDQDQNLEISGSLFKALWHCCTQKFKVSKFQVNFKMLGKTPNFFKTFDFEAYEKHRSWVHLLFVLLKESIQTVIYKVSKELASIT